MILPWTQNDFAKQQYWGEEKKIFVFPRKKSMIVDSVQEVSMPSVNIYLILPCGCVWSEEVKGLSSIGKDRCVFIHFPLALSLREISAVIWRLKFTETQPSTGQLCEQFYKKTWDSGFELKKK